MNAVLLLVYGMQLDEMANRNTFEILKEHVLL